MPETKKDTDQTVAKIIYRQIGQRGMTMIGARSHVSTHNSLRFRIGRNSKKVNYIQITLNELDLYDIEFSQVRVTPIPEYKTKATILNVYADMLRNVIEENTGMYLSL